METYEPSALGLALLEGIADARGKDAALVTIKEVRAEAEAVMGDLIKRYGPRSLYAMQSIGEIMLATVSGTLQKMVADKRH